MYSVVEIKGHQYRLSAGDLVDVQKIDSEVGSEINLDKVLFVGGDKALVGKPTVDGAKVTAKIIKQDRSRKVLVFKRKPGAWQKRRGHRQSYTALLITSIEDGQGGKSEIDKSSETAKKFLK